MTVLSNRAKFAGLASITLAATTAAVLFASQAAFATATPDDNGTVKVHNSTTPVTDHQNDPQDVCQFYALTMDANGDGYIANQSLPNGHYKLFWNFTGENGAAKQKVFWVKCPGAEPTPTSTTPDGTTTGTPPVPAAPAPTPVTGSLPVTG